MPKKSLEDRSGTLEKQFKEMQHQNERLKAVVEIQNVMGRYEYFHTADMQEETVALWARKAPNIVLPDGLKPDKVTRYWTSYPPASKTQLIPAPPEPYETWDEKMSYYGHVAEKDPGLSD
jgi:hypothetical protein